MNVAENVDIATIPQVVNQHARTRSNQLAVCCENQHLSWKQLDLRSNRVAHGLVESGCEPGDRVAILSENSAAYIEVLVGILKAGCCVVPLPTLVDAATLARMLSDSASHALFISAEKYHVLDDLKREQPGPCLENVIGFEVDDRDCANYSDWIDGQTSQTINRVDNLDQAYNIIYSSGTTGVPKGIVHSHQIRAGYAGVVDSLGFGPESSILISAGAYSNWSAMAMIIGLYAGGSLILMRKFTATNFFEIAITRQITDAFLVPAQVVRLLDDPDFSRFSDGANSRVWTAGSPLAIERKHELLQRWPGDIVEVYGQTEGAPATLLKMREAPDKCESVGKPLGSGVIEVIDDDGNLLPQGEKGELVGYSPLMISGYFNRPQDTENLKWRHPDGRTFFKSGDLGYIDDAGYVYILDRKKDMILSGGLNIYAADLEEVLAQHPAVQECAVIAVPSKRWGESPLGLVIKKPESTTGERELLAWANERLGKAQRLCALVFCDDFPRGSLDKILKRELREQYCNSGYGDTTP